MLAIKGIGKDTVAGFLSEVGDLSYYFQITSYPPVYSSNLCLAARNHGPYSQWPIGFAPERAYGF
ncbi:hypothetical protein KW850_29730 [Bacillus sp. sid0103]|uniref:hypothetical protein n=1 Tax=Bacillus sp. sid0103 TaxID=2856337 RepID=UPI001C45BD8E|nr:hypothetical protein [Bacillus sp. sid0103]MBV7509357.1 hypothetical protein [Bacillus sp. sid0103]